MELGFGLSTYILGLAVFYILSGLKVVKEYQRGVKFTLGKFSGIMPPGLRIVIPIFQSWQRVDIRVKAVDVPDQDAITKDNVSIKVNAVLYYKVADSKKAIIDRSAEIFVIADHTKINKVSTFHVCNYKIMDKIITDGLVEFTKEQKKCLKKFKEKNVDVIIAK